MKVLVIPDVHLKPWIIERASELLDGNAADRAVCLMDIADEWRQEYNLPLYVETYLIFVLVFFQFFFKIQNYGLLSYYYIIGIIIYFRQSQSLT